MSEQTTLTREQCIALLEWPDEFKFTDEQLRAAVENRRRLGRLPGRELEQEEAA